MTNELFIVVFDVEHGSAVYIRTPDNRHMMIDLGDNDSFSPLKWLKHQYGVRNLDQLIISHPHRDHIDDIFNLEDVPATTILYPGHLRRRDIIDGNRGYGDEGAKVQKYLEVIELEENFYSTFGKTTPIREAAGVRFLYFRPSACSASNLNNHSIVTVIEYHDFVIVIPGDNEVESWRELIQDKSFCEAIKRTTVFFASHHGHESGYCSELFDRMTGPRLVIVSDAPVTDTSVTGKYHSRVIDNGMIVNSRSTKQKERRKVLTTRKDKAITISVGRGYMQPVGMTITTE